MSRLQELIAELCPDGVEYVTLDESCYYPRERMSIDDLNEGAYVSVENLAQDFGGLTGEVATTKPGTAVICFHEGDVLVGNIRPYLKKVWLADFDGGTNGDVLVFRVKDSYGERLLPEFVYMQLASESFIDFDMKYAKGAKMPRGDKKAVLRYRIPVPPIEVQREVVRILDEYTAAHDELVRQLEEEMALRELQFSTAFEELVCSVDTETVALDKLALMTYGYTAKAVEDGDIRIIRITDIGSDGYLLFDDPKFIMSTAESSLKELTYGDVVVARTGGSYGKTLLYREDRPSVYASFLIKLDFDEDLIDSEYYWFFSRSEIYWNQANSLVSTGGQPQFNANALKRVMVPLPSLDDQRQIIEAMRVVESGIKGLSETLSHESEYRNQQLTLIRNQLLLFPEKVA